MYVSLSRLRVPPDRAAELVAAFRDRARLVDAFEGFVDLQVWQSDRDPGELVMVSRWDTRAHFTAYMRSRGSTGSPTTGSTRTSMPRSRSSASSTCTPTRWSPSDRPRASRAAVRPSAAARRGPRGRREIDLEALAREVCARYRAEYPDEAGRYGEAGQLWCVHDNQHLINWAALHARDYVVLDEQVAWLAGVLEAREFPLDRLARDLDIAAAVVGERVAGRRGDGGSLSGAAAMVRSRPTFL